MENGKSGKIKNRKMFGAERVTSVQVGGFCCLTCSGIWKAYVAFLGRCLGGEKGDQKCIIEGEGESQKRLLKKGGEEETDQQCQLGKILRKFCLVMLK